MRRKRRQPARVFVKQEVNYEEDTGVSGTESGTLSGEDRGDSKANQENQGPGINPEDSSFVERVEPAP